MEDKVRSLQVLSSAALVGVMDALLVTDQNGVGAEEIAY